MTLGKYWLLFFVMSCLIASCGPRTASGGMTLEGRFLEAIYLEQVQAVDSCLRKGVDPNLKDEEGSPALVLAVNTGNADIVRLLLTAKANVNAPREDFYKSTALMETAPGNDTILAALLIKAGADLMQRDSFGDTALHWASYYGHVGLVKILLDAGADWKIKSRHGSPVDQALRQWHDELALYFISRSAGQANEESLPLQTIKDIRAGNTQAVKEALKAGLSAHSKDLLGTPALTWAASAGQTDLVRLFLETGARVDELNTVGQTALSRAAFFGHEAVVDLLLEHGAKVDAAGPQYLLTPLISAASGGQAAIGKKLLDHGAQINQQEAVNGFTPLMLATAYGYPDFVKLLIRRKANPHIRSFEGVALPDMLDYSGNAEIAKLLEIYVLNGG